MEMRLSADSITDERLSAILSGTRTVAIVGASRKPERPSHAVMRYLLEVGYHVIPINPGHAGGEILGQPVFASLAEVPEPIDLVDIFRRPEALGAVVDAALALQPKPKIIWMQLGLVDEAAAARAEAAGVAVVMDRCTHIEHARLIASRPLAGRQAGAAFTGRGLVILGVRWEGFMETYEFVKFLHVVSAILWIGGGFVLVFLGMVADRQSDREGYLRIVRHVVYLSPRFFIPSSVWRCWCLASFPRGSVGASRFFGSTSGSSAGFPPSSPATS